MNILVVDDEREIADVIELKKGPVLYLNEVLYRTGRIGLHPG